MTVSLPPGPFHPEITPSSEPNKKTAPPKPTPPLKTCPVGADVVPPAVGGIVTIREETFETEGGPEGGTEYRVARPVPLSEIQNGDIGPNEMPQALTRSGSVSLASPEMS